MKNKKTTICISLLICLLFAFVACNRNLGGESSMSTTLPIKTDTNVKGMAIVGKMTDEAKSEYLKELKQMVNTQDVPVCMVNGENVFLHKILASAAAYKMNFSVNMNYYEQLPEKIEEKQKYLDEWQKNDDEIYAYCTDIRIKEMVIKQAAQKAGLTVADEDVKLSVKSNIENNREYEPEFFQNTLEALEMTLEEYENFRFETTKISALCNLYKNDWLEKNASSLKELDETKLLAAYDEHVAGLVSAAEIVKY